MQSYIQPSKCTVVTIIRKAVLGSSMVSKPLQIWGEAEGKEKRSSPSSLLFSASFIFYNEHNVYAVGYSCSQLRSAALADSKFPVACRP